MPQNTREETPGQEAFDTPFLFRSNFNRLLSEKGSNPTAFAREIGLSRGAVRQWCDGVALPEMAKLDDIARALGVPVTALLASPGQPKAPDFRESFFAIDKVAREMKEVLRAAEAVRDGMAQMMNIPVSRETIGGAGTLLDNTRPAAAGPNEWEGDE